MWSKLKGWFGGGGGDGGDGGGDGPSPRWLEPDDPGNPFGVRLLDLMDNLSMISTSRDPAEASRAVGWRAGMHREIALELDAPARPCELRFPVAESLPEGLVYAPKAMEDKWVLAYREGTLAAARSWTGETVALARVAHEGETLVATELRVSEAASFERLGDPARVFEWLVRTHAMGERTPLPVSAEGAEVLEATPLLGFSLFGRHLFCAAVDYPLPPPTGRLFSDGDLVAAVAAGDADALARAISNGTDVDAPCTFGPGASVLHLAIHLHPELVASLLEAGADPSAASSRGSTAVMAACAAGADPVVLERLIDAGAELSAADQLGFSALHVAAQFGRRPLMEVLSAHGADPRALTERGLTPLHVAAGTGARDAIEWWIATGLDVSLPSPLGTAVEIARGEGHHELAERLGAVA